MAEKQGVADLLDLIKNYARQETTEPLKGAGRWIGFGLLGSLLRFLQEEGGSWVTGNLSWLPYLFTLLALAISIGLLAWRITKKTL